MRKIIKQAGKYYAEETSIGAELTSAGVQRKLIDIQEQKERALLEVAARYDPMIAELESDLAAINTFIAAA